MYVHNLCNLCMHVRACIDYVRIQAKTIQYLGSVSEERIAAGLAAASHFLASCASYTGHMNF
jgi:hypothetical protein